MSYLYNENLYNYIYLSFIMRIPISGKIVFTLKCSPVLGHNESSLCWWGVAAIFPGPVRQSAVPIHLSSLSTEVLHLEWVPYVSLSRRGQSARPWHYLQARCLCLHGTWYHHPQVPFYHVRISWDSLYSTLSIVISTTTPWSGQRQPVSKSSQTVQQSKSVLLMLATRGSVCSLP